MKLLKVLFPVLFLAGCAATPVTETPVLPGSFPTAADLPPHWQLTGRISLVQGETGWHATLDWREQDSDFRLRVSGPLGQGGFLLTGNPGGVLLQDAAQQVYTAPDADTLLTEVTGWALPVSGLRYWVRGIPEPASPFRATVDAHGRLAQLSQQGWDIHFKRYHTVDDGRWPARLDLARDDIAVRMLIDEWQFGQSPLAGP